MDLKQIKDLLANEDVKRILAEEVGKQVAAEKARLTEATAALETQRKEHTKELYILKKTVIAKSNLYEGKLKEFYENKFNAAKKKLGKEVFDYINESVTALTKSIEESKKEDLSTSKLQEAFSQAVRLMAPYMNINELVESNQSSVNELKAKLNKALRENKALAEKAFNSGDLHTLVVKECTGYDVNKVGVIYETVRKMSPKSLTEGKEAIDAVKQALKEREASLVTDAPANKPTTVVQENVTAPTSEPVPSSRIKLKAIVENRVQGTAPRSNEQVLANAVNAGYDITNF